MNWRKQAKGEQNTKQAELRQIASDAETARVEALELWKKNDAQATEIEKLKQKAEETEAELANERLNRELAEQQAAEELRCEQEKRQVVEQGIMIQALAIEQKAQRLAQDKRKLADLLSSQADSDEAYSSQQVQGVGAFLEMVENNPNQAQQALSHRQAQLENPMSPKLALED